MLPNGEAETFQLSTRFTNPCRVLFALFPRPKLGTTSWLCWIYFSAKYSTATVFTIIDRLHGTMQDDLSVVCDLTPYLGFGCYKHSIMLQLLRSYSFLNIMLCSVDLALFDGSIIFHQDRPAARFVKAHYVFRINGRVCCHTCYRCHLCVYHEAVSLRHRHRVFRVKKQSKSNPLYQPLLHKTPSRPALSRTPCSLLPISPQFVIFKKLQIIQK